MKTVYIISNIAWCHLLSRPGGSWYEVARGKRGALPAGLIRVYETLEEAVAAVAEMLARNCHARVALGTLDEAGRGIKYILRLPKRATSLVPGRSV